MGLGQYDEKILKGGDKMPQKDRSANELLNKNRARAKKLIKLYMKELSNPEKIENAPINQIASALGTLIEKFGRDDEKSGSTIIVTHNIPRVDDES